MIHRPPPTIPERTVAATNTHAGGAHRERSTVKKAGRTVTDREALDPLHDELLLALYRAAGPVCQWLFGVEPEAVRAREEMLAGEATTMLAERLQRLDEMLVPGFAYADWPDNGFSSFTMDGSGFVGGDAPERRPPSENTLLAARQAREVLKALHDAPAPVDLHRTLAVCPSLRALRARLTSTAYRHGSVSKISEEGRVDLMVRYPEPRQIKLKPALLAGGDRVSLALDSSCRDREVLQYLSQIMRGASVGVEARGEHETVVLFTVRAHDWTVAEVVEEMRNLASTDAGRDAKVCLVVQHLELDTAAVIREQGFICVTRGEIDQAAGRFDLNGVEPQ